MTETKCPFCGSDKLVTETPYIELKKSGEYEPTTRYCCKAQADNQKFREKRYSNLYGEKPDVEEISEW